MEECDLRLGEEEQEEVLRLIAEILGKDESGEEQESVLINGAHGMGEDTSR